MAMHMTKTMERPDYAYAHIKVLSSDTVGNTVNPILNIAGGSIIQAHGHGHGQNPFIQNRCN